MKMRRLICLFIAALLLISSAPFVSAASDTEEKYITVDYNGTHYYHSVLVDKDGKVFAPTSILTNYGGLSESSSSTDYTFYRKSEQTVANGKKVFLAGARTIKIDNKGTNATVSCYVTKGNAKTVATVKFSGQHTVNKKLYLPLVELLPLIDAKTEITKDGVLHIYPNPVSAYDAIFRGNLDVFAFELDDVVYGDIVTATSLVIDTVLGFKYDRLMGAVSDYSSLFTKFLTINETYLKAFDEKETPTEKFMGLLSEESGNFEDAIGNATISTDMAEYIFSSTKHKTSEEFSDLLDVKVNDGIKIIEKGIELIEYANTAARQVDDHRDMLNAVFSKSNTSAGIGAREVYNLYSGNTVSTIKTATNVELRKYLTKLIEKQISPDDVLKPYEFAFNVVKMVLPDMSKEFNDGAEMYFVDKIANEAYTAAKSYYSNVKLDKASIEKQRLSLIMTLVASKYAYTSLYGESHDLIKPIDEWLERLYLAADSVECVSTGYYSSLKTELEASVKHLTVDDADGGETDNGDEDSVKENIIASGKCGKNANWTLDSYGTITISGKGIIDTSDEIPWYEYSSIIREVIINSGITDIGEDAFIDCHFLHSITLPSTITSIPPLSFFGCGSMGSGINSLIIPDSVTRIEDRAFYCGNLNSVYIPKGVTYIDATAFEDTGLSTVYYAGSEEDWKNIAISWEDIPTDDEGNPLYCETLYYAEIVYNYTLKDGSIPTNKIVIASGECGENATWVLDNTGTIVISGSGAMYDYGFWADSDVLPPWNNYKDYYIKTCIIEKGITSVGTDCFSFCYYLSTVNLADGIERIGANSFGGCDWLRTVHIPQSVKYIDPNAFADCCLNFDFVTYSGTIEQWKNINCDTAWFAAVPFGSVVEIRCSDGTIEWNCFDGDNMWEE